MPLHLNPFRRLNVTTSQIATLFFLCWFATLMSAFVQIPRTVNYQGYLTNPSGSAINNP